MSELNANRDQEREVIDDVLAGINSDGDLSEQDKIRLTQKFQELKNQRLNILITGATGSGKSSTINAMFNEEVAKVGIGVDPETMDIKKFDLKNMVLWDSPGLGDGKEADNRHAKNIIKKLNEVDDSGKALIDVVLVILDGASRDLGTSYELINQVIIPNLGTERENRILVAINKCDTAMSGHYWDREKNEPEPRLIEFMDEKVESVHRRILEGTGVDISPIYYSAGYTDEFIEPKPYNLSKLLYYIVKMTPVQKRLIYLDNVSTKPEMWNDDDGLEDYREGVISEMWETIKITAAAGAEIGGNIGRALAGKTGEVIGKVVGGAAGAILGSIGGAIRRVFSGW